MNCLGRLRGVQWREVADLGLVLEIVSVLAIDHNPWGILVGRVEVVSGNRHLVLEGVALQNHNNE